MNTIEQGLLNELEKRHGIKVIINERNLSKICCDVDTGYRTTVVIFTVHNTLKKYYVDSFIKSPSNTFGDYTPDNGYFKGKDIDDAWVEYLKDWLKQVDELSKISR